MRRHASAERAPVRKLPALHTSPKSQSPPADKPPRVIVADVDGEAFKEAQRGPIPSTGSERWKPRSCRFPRIEDRDAKTLEVLDVSRNDA